MGGPLSANSGVVPKPASGAKIHWHRRAGRGAGFSRNERIEMFATVLGNLATAAIIASFAHCVKTC
jgi:hypothetical protein